MMMILQERPMQTLPLVLFLRLFFADGADEQARENVEVYGHGH
jgi:hypothetical protein